MTVLGISCCPASTLQESSVHPQEPWPTRQRLSESSRWDAAHDVATDLGDKVTEAIRGLLQAEGYGNGPVARAAVLYALQGWADSADGAIAEDFEAALDAEVAR